MIKIFHSAVIAAFALTSAAALAQQMNGKMPLYPGAHNLNDMPANAIAAGVPMVEETADPVATVDAWYASTTGNACRRTAQQGAIKFQCASGSIMIYAKNGKTQIAFVPAMPF